MDYFSKFICFMLVLNLGSVCCTEDAIHAQAGKSEGAKIDAAHFAHFMYHPEAVHHDETIKKAHNEMADLAHTAHTLDSQLAALEGKDTGSLGPVASNIYDLSSASQSGSHHRSGSGRTHGHQKESRLEAGISQADTVLSRIQHQYHEAEEKREHLLEEVRHQQIEQRKEQKRAKVVLDNLEVKTERIIQETLVKEKEQTDKIERAERLIHTKIAKQKQFEEKLQQILKKVEDLEKSARMVTEHQKSLDEAKKVIAEAAKKNLAMLQKATMLETSHLVISTKHKSDGNVAKESHTITHTSHTKTEHTTSDKAQHTSSKQTSSSHSTEKTSEETVPVKIVSEEKPLEVLPVKHISTKETSHSTEKTSEKTLPVKPLVKAKPVEEKTAEEMLPAKPVVVEEKVVADHSPVKALSDAVDKVQELEQQLGVSKPEEKPAPAATNTKITSSKSTDHRKETANERGSSSVHETSHVTKTEEHKKPHAEHPQPAKEHAEQPKEVHPAKEAEHIEVEQQAPKVHHQEEAAAATVAKPDKAHSKVVHTVSEKSESKKTETHIQH